MLSWTRIAGGGLLIVGGYIAHSKYTESSQFPDFFKGVLLKKKTISPNLKVLCFKHSYTDMYNRNVFHHIHAVDPGNIYRSYTPIHTSPDTFEVLLRVYPTGYFSPKLDSMQPNEVQQFYGPKKTIEVNHIQRSIKHLEKDQEMGNVQNIIFVTAGSGIAPLLQFSANERLSSCFHISSIYFRSSTDNEIDEYLSRKLTNVNILNNKGQNKVSYETLKEVIPYADDTAVIVCGPTSFLCECCGKGHDDGNYKNQPELGGVFKQLGFRDEQVFRL